MKRLSEIILPPEYLLTARVSHRAHSIENVLELQLRDVMFADPAARCADILASLQSDCCSKRSRDALIRSSACAATGSAPALTSTALVEANSAAVAGAAIGCAAEGATAKEAGAAAAAAGVTLFSFCLAGLYQGRVIESLRWTLANKNCQILILA